MRHRIDRCCPVEENYGCNCRVKEDCPMQNKYLTPQIVHEAEITKSTDEELKIYYGLTETTFKEGTKTIKYHLTKDIAWKSLNYQK